MKLCGHRACPSDAVKMIKDISNFVSNYKGGYGAVREYCEFLLEERKKEK